MNCADFHELMLEHLDGTLPPEVQRASEQHVAGCEGCRAHLARHQALGEVVTRGFQRGTEGLVLRERVRRRIAAECVRRPAPAPMPVLERLLFLWRGAGWRWAVAVLVVVLICAGFAVIGTRMFSPPANRVAHVHKTPAVVSIHVPQEMTTYTFRREGGFVVDSLVSRTNVVQERLWANNRSSLPGQSSANRLSL